MPRLDAMSQHDLETAAARYYENRGWAAENADDDDLIADPDDDDGDTYVWAEG